MNHDDLSNVLFISRPPFSYKPQNETIAKLEEENQNIRLQLVEVQTQLSRFAVNTQLLNDSVSRALTPNTSSRFAVNTDEYYRSKNKIEKTNSYNIDEHLDFTSVEGATSFHTEGEVSGTIHHPREFAKVNSPIVDALNAPRELSASLFPWLGMRNRECCGALDNC